MMTEKRRVTITLPDDLREQIEKLKKDKYYNLSYSELYRQAILAGIEAIRAEDNQ